MEQDKRMYITYRKGDKRSPASPACPSPGAGWPSAWSSTVETDVRSSQGVADRSLKSYCDVNIYAARAELRHLPTVPLCEVGNESP
jgi:hypothetical protein